MADPTATPKAEEPRLDYFRVAPAALKGMLELEQTVGASSLDPKLLELVRMRASQINGCAFCLDMHSKDARARGEEDQRLFVLPAWRETSFFGGPERAALAWCESLTRISEEGAPEEQFEALSMHFSEADIVTLTLAIIAINGWNRLAIGFRSNVSEYVSPHSPESD